MSIQAIAWVLEHSETTLADRLVLLAIANHCDGRGYNAYPSIPLIAREARVDRATVYRAIDAIETAGELTVIRRPGKSNMYGIPAIVGSHPATGKGSQDATGGVASCDGRGRNLRPEPSLTVSEPRPQVGFPERCPQCGHFNFDCQCETIVDKERAKAWVQAIKRGDRPA